jgi:2-polyprenyl-6-hydroxyphenyl methylase/3-demethylubiquinone-9 3-methyltransferase
MFIKPDELLGQLRDANLSPDEITGFGPRGINRRGDATFGRLPFTGIIYMGIAHAAPSGGVAWTQRHRS